MIKLKDILKEATTSSFRFKNEPGEKIDNAKEWINSNPRIARQKPSDLDTFTIEVFGDNHKKEASELYKALKSSGYLKNHPLFNIKIEPIQ